MLELKFLCPSFRDLQLDVHNPKLPSFVFFCQSDEFPSLKVSIYILFLFIDYEKINSTTAVMSPEHDPYKVAIDKYIFLVNISFPWRSLHPFMWHTERARVTSAKIR